MPGTIWKGREVGTGASAKKHLKAMFPSLTPFDTPKPEELTARIMHIATNPGDLVIDFFGGSGTTGAVAQKMGRQWLVVEREPQTFYSFLEPRVEMVLNGEDPGGVTAKYPNPDRSRTVAVLAPYGTDRSDNNKPLPEVAESHATV